jgi:hypothetical protein
MVTPAHRSAIVSGMQQPDPQSLFSESVHDLAAEPTLENARRYLAASRLLDDHAKRRQLTRTHVVLAREAAA